MSALEYALLWGVMFGIGIAGTGLIDYLSKRKRRR